MPEQSQILINRLFYARSQHFDHHVAAIRQARTMYLCHRGCGQRIGIKFGKAVAQGFTQCRLDPLYGFFCREGRHLILKQCQLVGDVVG